MGNLATHRYGCTIILLLAFLTGCARSPVLPTEVVQRGDVVYDGRGEESRFVHAIVLPPLKVSPGQSLARAVVDIPDSDVMTVCIVPVFNEKYYNVLYTDNPIDEFRGISFELTMTDTLAASTVFRLDTSDGRTAWYTLQTTHPVFNTPGKGVMQYFARSTMVPKDRRAREATVELRINAVSSEAAAAIDHLQVVIYNGYKLHWMQL